MIKSFKRFDESFDWGEASSLVDGETYNNTVDGRTQEIVVPPIERIDIEEGVLDATQERLLEEVAKLCRTRGGMGEHLRPTHYYQSDLILHFANADDLRDGRHGGKWTGGFLVLWRIGRNPRYKKGVSAKGYDGPRFVVGTEEEQKRARQIRYKKGYVKPEPQVPNPVDPERTRIAQEMRKKSHLRNLESFNSFNGGLEEGYLYDEEIEKFTSYDISDYKKVGVESVVFYPRQKGSRDSFTLIDRSDIAQMKNILKENDIDYRKIGFGPYYFDGRKNPKSGVVFFDDKEDAKRLSDYLSSSRLFQVNYAN